MANFPPCVFQPQNFIHTILQYSSMCKNMMQLKSFFHLYIFHSI